MNLNKNYLNFCRWWKDAQQSFNYGQFDNKQIAFAAWKEGQKNKTINLPTNKEIVKEANKRYPYLDIDWNNTIMKRQLWIECATETCKEILKNNK